MIEKVSYICRLIRLLSALLRFFEKFANIILDTGDCSFLEFLFPLSPGVKDAETEDSCFSRGKQKCHPEISGCTSILSLLSIGQSTRSAPLFSSLLCLWKPFADFFLSPILYLSRSFSFLSAISVSSSPFHVRFLARGINYGTFQICP